MQCVDERSNDSFDSLNKTYTYTDTQANVRGSFLQLVRIRYCRHTFINKWIELQHIMKHMILFVTDGLSTRRNDSEGRTWVLENVYISTKSSSSLGSAICRCAHDCKIVWSMNNLYYSSTAMASALYCFFVCKQNVNGQRNVLALTYALHGADPVFIPEDWQMSYKTYENNYFSLVHAFNFIYIYFKQWSNEHESVMEVTY